MSIPDLHGLAGMPLDEEGPVFKAPWEAQAFALAIRLHEQGVFSWSEWTEQLARCIAAAQARGDPDLGDTYYEHWLAALETLVTAKGLVTTEMLAQRKDAIEQEQLRLHDH
ncbi:MAG: nitrile hydratase accessory protein [Gammaproteobacteria bacterium]